MPALSLGINYEQNKFQNPNQVSVYLIHSIGLLMGYGSNILLPKPMGDCGECFWGDKTSSPNIFADDAWSIRVRDADVLWGPLS